jgi:hypothetical protein
MKALQSLYKGHNILEKSLSHILRPQGLKNPKPLPFGPTLAQLGTGLVSAMFG